MSVKIYEFNNFFDVYDVNGKPIKIGFTTEAEAVYFCKKNNYNLIDVFFAV